VARKKIEPKRGDVFEIPLPDGRRGYGQVLDATMSGFFAIASDDRLPIEEVVASPVAFRIWCMSDCIRKGIWPIIGNLPLPPAMREPLKLFRTTHPDFWFLIEWRPETGGGERRVPKEEVSGLEADGMWLPENVAQRLLMHLRGEPCPWVEIA
jgi:hypothetical protein